MDISDKDIDILVKFCNNFNNKELLVGLDDKTWHFLYKLIKKSDKQTDHSNAIINFYNKIFLQI